MRVLYNKLRCVANPNWYANRVEWIQTDLTLEVYPLIATFDIGEAIQDRI